MSDPGIVVLGGGHAASSVLAGLRTEGYSGPLRMVSAESVLPYHRPPLSKAFLKDPAAAHLPLRPDIFYVQQAIDVDLDTTVARIDRSRRALIAADGREIPYDRLVIATGSEPRRLTLDGSELSGVATFQTIADARHLRDRLAAVADVVIVGGGFIGLEIAATCAKLGKRTTVLEAGPRLMGRAVSPEISDFMLDAHRRYGVQVHLSCPPLRFSGAHGSVTAVETKLGSIPADLVVIGVGSAPRTALAEAAGLDVEAGILVDEALRTNDPAIWACGDATIFPVEQPAGRLRLESVQNATDQGKHVALSMLGKTDRYAAVPWFWSDQGDIKLQMVGRSSGADESVFRGTAEAGKFSVFHYAGGQLIGVDSINAPADHMLGRRILAKGDVFTPAMVATLADRKAPSA